MKVSEVIARLQDLPPDSQVCIQWYDQEDMTKYGEKMTEEIWNLATAIYDGYEEIDDMYYTVEQAITDARIKLGIEDEEDDE
jgi:hypothetical protein